MLFISSLRNLKLLNNQNKIYGTFIDFNHNHPHFTTSLDQACLHLVHNHAHIPIRLILLFQITTSYCVDKIYFSLCSQPIQYRLSIGGWSEGHH